MANEIARIKTDFSSAAADKKIDEPEAKRIIRRVRENKLTESEAKTFRNEMALNKDFFNPGAAVIFADFEKIIRRNTVLDAGPRPNPGGLPDPTPAAADIDRLEQEMVKNAELFRNGISAKDPEQLYLGDCFLVAAMSAVADTHPEVIKKAFKKVGANYEVSMFTKSGKTEKVTIDTDLPHNSWYGWYYARAHDSKEIWPALLEKAFAAKAGNSYEGINGGLSGDAMQQLTGKKSVDTLTRASGVTADTMFAQLKAAVAAKKPTTAATYGDSSAAKYTGTNIHTDHTYVVLGTSREGGVNYVKLRNPWGNSEPVGNGRDDGIFKLDMPTFMKLFWGISING